MERQAEYGSKRRAAAIGAGARRRGGRLRPARYTWRMAIIDEELFVRCTRCGSEVATGVRRSAAALTERPPGSRGIVCHRCGHAGEYGDDAYYHRTVEPDRQRGEG